MEKYSSHIKTLPVGKIPRHRKISEYIYHEYTHLFISSKNISHLHVKRRLTFLTLFAPHLSSIMILKHTELRF